MASDSTMPLAVRDSCAAWPRLDTPGWTDTCATIHMWSQIVGKTRMSLEPMVNHWWQVPLYVTACGLATPVLYDGDHAFEVELDLTRHALRVRDDRGEARAFALAPMSVREFHRRYLETLDSIGVQPSIWRRPVEVVEAIPFDQDEVHRSYDPNWARALTTTLQRADGIFEAFRGEFVGKSSPVHFFWGAFDLAVTRFSGRTAPRHPGGIPNCADRVMHEAYSHEVSSAGFWPGSADFPEAVFYSYAYPEPEGFARASVRPAAARYHPTLREFVLPYEAVRASADPAGEVRAFLASTYEAAAELSKWDRKALERRAGEVR